MDWVSASFVAGGLGLLGRKESIGFVKVSKFLSQGFSEGVRGVKFYQTVQPIQKYKKYNLFLFQSNGCLFPMSQFSDIWIK